MALPSSYPAQHCSVARALDVLGERWTLLIVRDAFYGLRRFKDFVDHLDIPRAVLTARLKTLEDEGVLARVPGPGKRTEYELTEKGLGLWPIVRGLMTWGDEHYAPAGPLRRLRHQADDGQLDADGRCAVCRQIVPVGDTVVERGPGFGHDGERTDAISTSMNRPHRLLDPVRIRWSA
jgi:DNA-binding HxlR family transcriptional regulator